MDRAAKGAMIGGWSRPGLLLVLAAVVVSACAQGAPASAPFATTTPAPAPSQVAAVAQQSTPYSTRTATPVPPSETPLAPTSTATTARTLTPVPPTYTPLAPTSTATAAPTMTPPPPTITPNPDPTSAHKEYFTQKGRFSPNKPLKIDVTGDGESDFIYLTYASSCGSCHLALVTVFSGPAPIFDDGTYFDPVIDALPDSAGFTITEMRALPGEPLAKPSGRIVWTFRWEGSKFAFGGKREYTVNANRPNPVVVRYKADLLAAIDKAILATHDVIVVCPGANPYFCETEYNAAVDALNTLNYFIFTSLGDGFPKQCEDLWLRVFQLARDASGALDAPSASSSTSGAISSTEAVARALYAQQQLSTAKQIIVNDPGTCR